MKKEYNKKLKKKKKTGKKLKKGGKDTEHYFCARNVTNSYF